MNVLVTGADGFVGRRLVRRLLEAGHSVTGTVGAGEDRAAQLPAEAVTVPLELRDELSVRHALEGDFEAVVHLAAVASGADAHRDPGTAWEINAAGTARVADALGRRRRAGSGDPLLLVASTAEVYGRSAEVAPRRETDPPAPVSPYAASKLGAELAALEVQRRTGLRVVVTRAFPHTGAGQDERFVVPAFARRLRTAKRVGATAVEVGNLEPVRDFLHVEDVVDAYVRLLGRGTPGAVYNIASGQGISIGEIFRRLAALLDMRVVAEVAAPLVRPADIPHLVGDASRLCRESGWRPQRTLEDALREVIGAQAD